MKIFAITVSIFLVVLGVYASRHFQLNTMKEADKEVLSETIEDEVEVETTQTPTLSPPTETPTPAPTKSSGAVGLPTLSVFFYPGATLVAQTASTLSLESSDDTDKITDWYKDKIKNLGVNVKSFVSTRANDKVLNKLVGATNELEISVEISKDPGAGAAKISVTLK